MKYNKIKTHISGHVCISKTEMMILWMMVLTLVITAKTFSNDQLENTNKITLQPSHFKSNMRLK